MHYAQLSYMHFKYEYVVIIGAISRNLRFHLFEMIIGCIFVSVHPGADLLAVRKGPGGGTGGRCGHDHQQQLCRPKREQ